jgi:hypothetical protein
MRPREAFKQTPKLAAATAGALKRLQTEFARLMVTTSHTPPLAKNALRLSHLIVTDKLITLISACLAVAL